MKSFTKNTTLEELAGIVSEHLKSKGIQPTLVGGAVVTIYSKNEYRSHDLDLISAKEKTSIIL